MMEESDDDNNGTCLNPMEYAEAEHAWKCHLRSYDTNLKMARGLGEVILVILSVYYLVMAVRELMFGGWKLMLATLALCPSRIMFLTACMLCIIAIPFRLSCAFSTENSLAILIMLLTGPYFLFFCRGFKTTGPFVIMIYRMMAADLLRFVTIYFIFVMGFSQGFID